MEFTITKCGKETSNGNYILTLVNETEVDLGFTTTINRQKYLMAARKPVEVGTEIDLDLNLFTSVADDYEFTSETTGEVIKGTNHWLKFKRAI